MSGYLDNQISSEVREKPLNAFDIETTGDKNEFLMGSVVGDSVIGEKEVYWDRYEMLNALMSKRFRSEKIYATNLEFDLLSLIDKDYINNKGWDLEIFHNGANIIYGKLRKNKNLIEFRDSLNIAPFSVGFMGDIIDLPKKDIDVENLENVPKDKIEEYNIRDSKITYEFLKWLQSEIVSLGGNMEITSAKTSMNLFRRQYLKDWIQQPTEDLIKEGYEAYYGGRVSPFTKGKIDSQKVGKIRCYDVASLYPHVMRSIEFPQPKTLRFSRGREDFENMRERIDIYEGISKVTVEAPQMDKPVLPLRTESKLLFPVGIFTGYYTHNELRYAIDNGYEIKSIEKQQYTTSSFNPFENFVCDMFEKRLKYREEENPSELVTKLMMNSLYGKFGQKLEGDGGIYQPMSEKHSFENLEEGTDIEDGWVVEEPEDNRIPSYINPIIASYVTAGGRIELHKWIRRAQERGGEVYYCDTDSLYTNVDMEVENEKKLGKLDFEDEYDVLYSLAPKVKIGVTNDGETEITAKGIPKGVANRLLESLKRGNKKLEYEKFASFRESIGRDYMTNDIIETHRTLNIETPSKREHEKVNLETIMNERIDTNPFRVDGIETGDKLKAEMES